MVAQVDVGDFLRFKSCVLYTQLDNPEQPLVNVEVVAHVTRPELRKSEVTIPESHSVYRGLHCLPCISSTLVSPFSSPDSMLADSLTMLSNEQVSNTFHFTFTVCSDTLKNGLKIRNVVPSTEEEARRILERMEAEGLCN